MILFSEGLFSEFDTYIEKERNFWNVPGLAVSIVAGDKTVYSRGFGVRDLDTGVLVDNDTVFRLASNTKPFVALAAGMLVDDGLLGWDVPIKNYVPGFKMYDDFLTERLTIRDLLCHRSGLPSHDEAFDSDKLTRRDCVMRLRYLENNHDLRTTLQYNSNMFMLAGYVIECVSGKTWEEFTRERILGPLEMDNTYLSLFKSRQSGNFTEHYYEMGEEKGKFDVDFLADYDPEYYYPGNPAGGMVSSANDLAKFMNLHINNGVYKEKRLISDESLYEILKPNMVDDWFGEFPQKINPCAALGWFTFAYKGLRIVSMVGFFGAQYFLIPEVKLALVFLPSKMSGAKDAIPLQIIDRILELKETDWRAVTEEVIKKHFAMGPERRPAKAIPMGIAAQLPTGAYAGLYEHPAYMELDIRLKDGVLGLVKYSKFNELRHVSGEVFETDEMRFTFQTKNGSALSVSAPYEPEVSDIVFVRSGT